MKSTEIKAPSEEAMQQAEQLFDFTRRGGNPALWMATKDHTPERLEEIEQALKMLREKT